MLFWEDLGIFLITYSWVAEVWNPFFNACSLALLRTVSRARAFDRSPDNLSFPVMNAVAGASSPVKKETIISTTVVKM